VGSQNLTVAEFMSQARSALAGGVTKASLAVVAQRLSEVSQAPDFIPAAELKTMHGSDSTASVLQTDADGLTLVLGLFSPKAETPIHDHNSWGIACVVRGEDRYRHWDLGPDGRLTLLYERVLSPGDFVTWLDPPSDIHSQQGIGKPVLELVLFGKNSMALPRRYFNVDTGEVRTALPQ
jgi:predicted metal-dependent enzyme (double-stranded beta helix superfamily)